MLNALLIQPIRILTQMCVTSIMHIVMRLLSGRRRRFFRVISFIAAASCIFLAFQFFSLEILNTHPKKHLPTQSTVLQVLHKMTMVTENCGSDGCANKKSELFKMESAVRQEMGGHGYKYRLTKYTARLGQLTPAPMAVADVAHIDVKLANQAKMSANRASQLPRGVPPESRKSYIPDSHNHFTCIHSKEQIAFDRINDDYCDCSDSSDEPGTSACPDSRFYCTVRVAVETGKLWVPASRVNDGICDCCDGSDEWRNFTVMDDIKFKDSDQNNLDIYQAPCHDRCSSVLALQSGADRVRLQGLQAKKAYIAAAGKMNMYTAKRYGPDGAFYLLSNICYQFDTSTYHYTVCPFRDIKQQKLADSSSHVLGRESSWLVDGVGGQYRLKMAGGDGIQCPNSKSRSTIIEFVCDVKDHVISVREDEVCIYLIKFSTPAACQS